MDSTWDSAYKWTKNPQIQTTSLPSGKIQVIVVHFTDSNFDHPFPMPHQLPCPHWFPRNLWLSRQTRSLFWWHLRYKIYTILYCICDKLSPALNLQNSCDFLIESFSIIMEINNILPILLICSSLSMGQIIIQQPKNFRPCLKSVFRKRVSKLNFPDVSGGNRGLPDLCWAFSMIRHVTMSPIQSPTSFKYQKNDSSSTVPSFWLSGDGRCPFHHRHTNYILQKNENAEAHVCNSM